MFCHHWHRNRRSDMIEGMHCMMHSKSAMVLVAGTLMYLGAKTIHHMMND